MFARVLLCITSPARGARFPSNISSAPWGPFPSCNPSKTIFNVTPCHLLSSRWRMPPHLPLTVRPLMCRDWTHCPALVCQLDGWLQDLSQWQFPVSFHGVHPSSSRPWDHYRESVRVWDDSLMAALSHQGQGEASWTVHLIMTPAKQQISGGERGVTV